VVNCVHILTRGEIYCLCITDLNCTEITKFQLTLPIIVQNHPTSIPIQFQTHVSSMWLRVNLFWDSKPELFSDIACLWIPYQPSIVLFGNFFLGTPASNRRELRLHLNVVPIGAGVFKSRHILLHKYINRIMITYMYLWCQIQLIIPSRRFRSIVILTCFESMSRDRFFHYMV
jgi:hypothetical protein